MATSTLFLLVTTLLMSSWVAALTLQNGYVALNQPRKAYYRPGLFSSPSANSLERPGARYCPYCDSSVYGYCSDKLLHDACCCLDPYSQPLPRECRHADCSFLHANTCQEHSLITSCCCTNFV